MAGLRVATSWHLACGVLGSGLVVFPPLAAALDDRTGAAVVAAGCVAVVAVGLLFRYRPFGRSRITSVSRLPVRWRLIYLVGFLGGSSYFATVAVSLLGLLALPVAVAIGSVLLGALALGLAPPVPAPVKLAAAVGSVLALAASPAVSDLLGHRSAGGVPLLTAGAAATLLTVGWEAVPSRAGQRAEVLAAGLLCCLVVVAGYLWLRYQSAPGGSGSRLVAGWTATVLVLFLSGNLRAIGTFWAPHRVGRSAVRYRVLAALAVLVLMLVQRELFARGWLLLLPAAATSILYGSYAAGRPGTGTRQPDAAGGARLPIRLSR